MNRHLAMLILAIVLAVWVLIALSPWIIVGPWNLANRLQRDLNG